MDNNGVSGVNNSVAVYVGNFALVNKAENKLFKQDNVGGVGSVVKVNVANSAHPYGDSGHVIGNGGGGGNNLSVLVNPAFKNISAFCRRRKLVNRIASCNGKLARNVAKAFVLKGNCNLGGILVNNRKGVVYNVISAAVVFGNNAVIIFVGAKASEGNIIVDF